jgi:hypothetical protein
MREGVVRKEPSIPDLWAVVAPACAAASVGVLAGLLGAVRQINPELILRYDGWAGLCAVTAGWAGWRVARGLWRLSRWGRHTEDGSLAMRARVRRQVMVGWMAMGGATLLGFGVAVLGLPDSRRSDMVWGGLFAVAVLGAVGWLVYRLARLFGDPDSPDTRGTLGDRDEA